MAGAGVRDILIEGPWRHREISANGIRFHFASGLSADASRPLIVLLHGFGEFWWAWRHQIDVLDRAGYAVVALDLRGYGASDKTPRGYDPQTTAGDIAGVIRGLGYRQAVLVGHDWGGMAAWSTSAYAPAQVRGLVAVASPHPLHYPWRHDLRNLAFFQLPLLPERRMMAEDGAFIEELHRSRAAPRSSFLSAADARHYRDALMLWPSPHCALEYQRMFVRDQVRSAGQDYRRALRNPVPVPTLSVHGHHDPILPRASMAAAERHLSGPRAFIDLPHAGHLPHEETPDAFNKTLLNWLATLPAPHHAP